MAETLSYLFNRHLIEEFDDDEIRFGLIELFNPILAKYGLRSKLEAEEAEEDPDNPLPENSQYRLFYHTDPADANRDDLDDAIREVFNLFVERGFLDFASPDVEPGEAVGDLNEDFKRSLLPYRVILYSHYDMYNFREYNVELTRITE